MRSRKGFVYEGGHRIPFIAAWPLGGIAPGSENRRLLGLNDLYATVASILGKPLLPEQALDSRDQLPALLGKAMPPRAPLFPNDHQEASRSLSDARAWGAVRSNATPIPGQWKLFLDETFAYHGKLQPKELYNLAADPREKQNLLGDPEAKPALDYLLVAAKAAAGDSGRTRPLK